MSIGTLVLAVDDKSLLDLHVNFPGHLRSQIPRRVLIEPLLTQNIKDVSVVLLLKALGVKLGVGVDLTDQVEEVCREIATTISSLIIVLQNDF